MEPVYVPRSPHEKSLQRALLQWRRPEFRRLVLEALHKAERTDLIGFGKQCLIRPNSGKPEKKPEQAKHKAAKNGAPQSVRNRPQRAENRAPLPPADAPTEQSRKGILATKPKCPFFCEIPCVETKDKGIILVFQQSHSDATGFIATYQLMGVTIWDTTEK